MSIEFFNIDALIILFYFNYLRPIEKKCEKILTFVQVVFSKLKSIKER